MAGHLDYLGVLAPRQGAASARKPPLSNLFGTANSSEKMGVAMLAMAAGQGALKGAEFLQSEQGQALMKKLHKTATDDEVRYKAIWVRYRNKAKTTKSPKNKKKYRAKAARYHERYELAKTRTMFADRGIGGKGPLAKGTIKEWRRNRISMDWDTASPARKKEIERLVAGYDKELVGLKRDAEAMTQSGYGRVRRSESKKQSRGPSDFPMTPQKAEVLGLGGLGFTAQSPPGAGRLCRLPMYPRSDADAMSGATGLVSAGDDPFLLMQLTRVAAGDGFVAGPEYEVVTRQLQYGTYRVLGIQCSFQENYVGKDQAAAFAASTIPLRGVGVTVRSLQVYNGAELLLPLNDLDASSFQLLPIEGATYLDDGLGGGMTGGSFHQQARYNWQRRLGSLFMGLREYAVVDSDATLTMKVQAFAGSGAAGGVENGFTIPVPVCFNLVCEILTDKVYGNPRVPSPAARAGALVKLGASETATASATQSAFTLTSARWRPPE